MNAADDLAILARVTASLVVVLALAVLAARFARRAGVRGGGAGLRVVERTGLSREASVAVVEVAGRGLVLGVTAHGVTLLTELEPGQLETAAAAAAAGAGSGAAGPPRRDAGQIRRVVSSGLRAASGPQGTGSVLDPRTWRQAVESLRDLTARRP
jgi:flagellar biosynthetic protein FliO